MINLLLVDDNNFVREALTAVFRAVKNVKIIGKLDDGYQVMRFLSTNKVDVILMDVRMTGMNGKVTTFVVKENYPNIQIIGLSFESCEEEMINAGATKFLNKWNVSNDEIRQAVIDCFKPTEVS